MSDFFRTEVMVYLASVVLAIGMLLAITAVPGRSAELFPGAGAHELMQAVDWAWSCALRG
jgi:hypothetical protein